MCVCVCVCVCVSLFLQLLYTGSGLVFGITSKDVLKGEWKEVALPDKNVKVITIVHMYMYMYMYNVMYICVYMYEEIISAVIHMSSCLFVYSLFWHVLQCVVAKRSRKL